MASRKQKRARKFRARAHQDAIRGTTARVEHTLDDGTVVVIEEPRGPKPMPGAHADDPMKYGLRADAREMARRHLQSLGIEDPTYDACYEFSRLVRRCGGDVAEAKARLEKSLTAAYDEVAQRMVDTAISGFSVVDTEGRRVDPTDVQPPSETLDTYKRMREDPTIMESWGQE